MWPSSGLKWIYESAVRGIGYVRVIVVCALIRICRMVILVTSESLARHSLARAAPAARIWPHAWQPGANRRRIKTFCDPCQKERDPSGPEQISSDRKYPAGSSKHGTITFLLAKKKPHRNQRKWHISIEHVRRFQNRAKRDRADYSHDQCVVPAIKIFAPKRRLISKKQRGEDEISEPKRAPDLEVIVSCPLSD